MKHILTKYLSILVILAAVLSAAAPQTAAKGAPFSFDSVWFYRDGTRVVPEISSRWLTVVFEPRYLAGADEFEATGENGEEFIRNKAKAMLKSHDRLVDYLQDPNIAEDACFFRMRDGLKLEEISRLMNELSRDGTVKYVHPALVLDDKTFAFFNSFEMEWKTGAAKGERDSLLRAAHAAPDEKAERDNRYRVDVTAIPYFRAVNLLAEDIRVLRVTPILVEIKPSIRARLSLPMSGGNIGDSIPFSLTIYFSERVSIDPSSIATLNLRPPEIQKELFDSVFDPYDYAKAVSSSPIVITGRVRFFAPGEFTIPSVKISYTCTSCPGGAGAAVRSIETKPVLFKVASIVPAVQSENRLMVPTDPVSPDLRLAALHEESRRSLLFAVICFVGLLSCAALIIPLRRRATAERAKVRERKRNGRIAEQLRALLQAEPTVPHWSYLGEAGAMLRDYLAAICDAKYSGGSGGRFVETIETRLPGECVEPLGDILAAIDNAVATETERFQDIDRFRSDILELVDRISRESAGQR